MPYEKEEDERSEINWDRLGGEGVPNTHRTATTHYSLLTFFAPPHHYVVPSPYKQGESAVRIHPARLFLLSPFSFLL